MTFKSECAHYYRILIQKEGGTQEERWKHELSQLNMNVSLTCKYFQSRK